MDKRVEIESYLLLPTRNLKRKRKIFKSNFAKRRNCRACYYIRDSIKCCGDRCNASHVCKKRYIYPYYTSNLLIKLTRLFFK